MTKSDKQTACEVTPCPSTAGLPIIGLPALLKLVAWHCRRREHAHGDPLCDTLRTPPPPPAPTGPAVPQTGTPAVVDAPPAGSAARAAEPAATGRAATRPTSRAGGAS